MSREEPFAPYAAFLDTVVWPSVTRGDGVEHVVVADMAPQHAASALAKLVRWARIAPEGLVAMHPDEDSREEAVRATRLGIVLAARAVNMTEEHFYALYGEFGVLPDADPHLVLAELVVALGDFGLGDWTMQQRIALGARVLERLGTTFALKQRR